jgi:hypothetical protein
MRTPSHPLLLLAAAALVAAIAGCSTLSAPGLADGPPAAAPAYRVGDRWVYGAEDGFRVKVTWTETHEVTALGADGITVRVTQQGPGVDNRRTEQWAAPGLVRVGALFDDETRRFGTPLVRYEFPLTVGRSWNQWVDQYDEQTKREGRINRYVRAAGWGSVTTPAGTFDAIALRVVMTLDDEEFWRYATRCNYLVWYAPAVRGIVKEARDAQYLERGGDMDSAAPIRSQHAVLELVSFTPGAP